MLKYDKKRHALIYVAPLYPPPYCFYSAIHSISDCLFVWLFDFALSSFDIFDSLNFIYLQLFLSRSKRLSESKEQRMWHGVVNDLISDEEDGPDNIFVMKHHNGGLINSAHPSGHWMTDLRKAGWRTSPVKNGFVDPLPEGLTVCRDVYQW